MPLHLYDESIVDVQKLQELTRQFKDTPGAMGKDGPLQKVLEMGYKGASPGMLGAARGAVNELEFASMLEKKGNKIIDFSKIVKKPLGKEYDVCTIDTWYECKNINWNHPTIDYITKIKLSIPEKAKIAMIHNKQFILYSKQPIPDELKTWLTSKNITFLEGIL